MKISNHLISFIILIEFLIIVFSNWHVIYNYLIVHNHIYEFLGVTFSIIYVIFSIRQNILCWPALIIAAILNGYAFYDIIGLPLQAIMQLFFISVGISGWKNWRKKDNAKFVVHIWNKNQIILWISLGLTFTFFLNTILVFLQDTGLESKNPFFDSLMFVFNIIPMYMTTKKVIQSWIIFIFIDIISGFFYLYTGDYFYCFLFFFYIPFAIYGYLNWKKYLPYAD